MRDFSSIIRYQRELRGWSQEALVDEMCKLCSEDGYGLGLTTKTISRWENGKCKPSPFYRKRLCLLFGMNAEELGLIESC